MLIKEALNFGQNKLEDKLLKTALLDTEILLTLSINKPKEYLFTYPENKLTSSQFKKFQGLLKRRLKGEPIAYIKNSKEFYGLNFYVNDNVLIPRPETETIIDEVKNYLKTSGHKVKLIADIGTGSGAIAVTLAKIFPQINIIATDISEKALSVAKKNTKKNKVKIKFFKGNLLEPIKKQKVDIICANLPYLDNNYLKKLPKNIILSLRYEPRLALKAGSDGFDLYRKLFTQINKFKILPKFAIFEIDNNQTAIGKILAKKYFPQAEIKIKKDLAGLNRFLIIKFELIS